MYLFVSKLELDKILKIGKELNWTKKKIGKNWTILVTKKWLNGTK